jgi:hypothetical protein
VTQTKTRARFMGEKSEGSNELIGNQGLECAFASGVRTELTCSMHSPFNICAC